MKKALIFHGGWDGHEPDKVANIFKDILIESGYEVIMSNKLKILHDTALLNSMSLIVPCWTSGEIKSEYAKNILNAVANGVGIAGCHGGMCDAFRGSPDWQFLTGSQWVAHPGNDGVKYMVNINKSITSPITAGIDDFEVSSEQYYLHGDPAVKVLDTTLFPATNSEHGTNGEIIMPVVYTKTWGKGKVFYCSLGHHADIFDIASARQLMSNGFKWAEKEGENK